MTQCQTSSWYKFLLSDSAVGVAGDSFMTQCQTSLWYNLLLSDSAVGVAWGELHDPVSDILMV